MWALLGRCGPLSLMGASILLIAGAPLIDGPTVGAAACAATALVVGVLVGSTRFPLVRLLPAALAVASITWSNWLLSATHDWGTAAGAGLRVAFFVAPSIVFASYLDPFTIGDHLGQRLRLPARPVLASVAALQRFDDLGQDWADAERVRRVRGLAPGNGPVARTRHWAALLFGLLVEAIRTAGRMTVAMESRGYSAPGRLGRPRTWVEPAPWTGADTALIVIAALLGALPLALRAVL